MQRRCLKCMKIFNIPSGYEGEPFCCPFCGTVENPYQVIPYALIKGTVLQNRYLIGDVIGFGGFGITYIAFDYSNNKAVAIKEYYPRGVAGRISGNKVSRLSTDGGVLFEEGRVRFIQEAKNLVRFNYLPGIVSIFDFFETNNTAYIVMELLDGYNVKQIIQKKGTPKIEFIYRMAEDICSVLGVIHAGGIIHRDISADNIFICRTGEFKLIDFGAARQSFMLNLKSSELILKKGYAPVEQYNVKGNIGPWTDIYALAVTMYIILTGRSIPEAISRSPGGNDIIPPGSFNPRIPKHLNDAIMKALSFYPQNRYQNAIEFREEIMRR